MTKLTDEQKARFAPMLTATWQAIGPDCESTIEGWTDDVDEIVEMVCDANRVQAYGGMSDEDYAALCAAYNDRDTRRWLRSVLNY
jgi:hypothetical protein